MSGKREADKKLETVRDVEICCYHEPDESNYENYIGEKYDLFSAVGICKRWSYHCTYNNSEEEHGAYQADEYFIFTE